MAELLKDSHRRYNPLTGEWILVSPQRTQRPWQGQVESTPGEDLPTYDPACYLCPGNRRANSATNPQYEGVFVFENDYPALSTDTEELSDPPHPMLRAQSERGICRVICYSPSHDLTLARMPVDQIQQVADSWAAQTAELGQRYPWVQIFENKGALMGSSSPHPHGQIWAVGKIPNEPAKEDRQQREYQRDHRTPLLVDYAGLEAQESDRTVAQNEHWLAVVPYWAVWPFETLLIPRRHVARMPELSQSERRGLANILKRLLTQYDNLFEVSFPYSMGWHGAPNDGRDHPHWQLHAHFYPPLLRSATIRKFMVGYEILAEAQRDLTAEQAAERLRAVAGTHYSERPAGSQHASQGRPSNQ